MTTSSVRDGTTPRRPTAATRAQAAPPSRWARWRAWLRTFGPGVVTGASDDDPSGIGTYAQAGAQFGIGLLWTMLLTYPLMVAIQEVSARVGRVTGHGLAGNLRRAYPRWVLYALVGCLVVANTINIGADIAAMGASAHLLFPRWPPIVYATVFALVSALLQTFVPYDRYARVLMLLTASLLTYVAAALVVDVPWLAAAKATVLPHVSMGSQQLMMIVAVLGTTISPYLFFWQASQEVEEEQLDAKARPLVRAPWQARKELQRISVDTRIGMAASNAIAWFIMLTTAATLNAKGVTDIDSAAQAAAALAPVAGRFASLVFAAGIVGTGLLAVPVLAGSASYAVGEALRFPVGLQRPASKARVFYGVIVGATMLGLALNLTAINPMRALVYTAVVNGVVAVPVMAMMMVMADNPEIMGNFVLPRGLRVFGWAATAIMTAVTVAMFATFSR